MRLLPVLFSELLSGRRRMRTIMVAALALLAVGPAGEAMAQSAPPAYSADAVYRAPDGSESSGRVVKSGANMRLEFTQNGQPVVQIIRRAEGLMYVLDPGRKSYYTIQGAADPSAGNTGYAPPCDRTAQAATCRFLGTEKTSGIEAEVWELGPAGQATRILWDGARKRALRQEFPDGSVMAMTFVGMENIEGRQVEHWQIQVSAPGQSPLGGNWYYDPELRVELREELPTGERRSLEHVAVGPVDPALFEPPAGWREVAPPQPPAPSGN